MRGRRLLVIAATLAVSAVVGFGQSGDRPAFGDEARLRQYLNGVAERVQLPEKCGECHKSEYQVWQTTRHATQFQDLHTTERAKKIYRALNLQLIRRATDERTPGCLACHYTPQLTSDGLRAQISVGCESCHGPARDWIGVHNNYGVPEGDPQKAVKLENDAHKLQRIADSKAKGMRRPSEIYDVAANCFQCHTVPYEELVNRGGHSSGSDFELVAWSQKIRHNFLRSELTGDGKTNAETSSERRRIMFVVGRALAVEYSLRGIAVATKDDAYLASMIDRHGYAVDALMELNDGVGIPEIAAILDVVKDAALKANNREALTAAADKIGEATRHLIAHANPTRLAAVDGFLNQGAAVAKGSAPTGPAESAVAAARPESRTPASVATAPAAQAPTRTASQSETPAAKAPVPAPKGAGPTVAEPPQATNAPAQAAAVAPAPVQATPAPIRAAAPPRRPSWRPEPAHGLLPVPCGKCHDPQTRWWRGDSHSKAVEPFRTIGTKQRQIAVAYGIGPAEINSGNQICMSCHGTVVGNPAAKVRAGVGCQQCHGAGADYKESHLKNRKQALADGLVDLKIASTRAETCAGCHYITEPRLIEAGHSTGEDFKIDASVATIKHWGKDFEGQAADISGPQLVTAFAGVIAKRGPIPRVARAAASTTTPVAPAGAASVALGRDDAAGRSVSVAGERPAGAAAPGSSGSGGAVAGVAPVPTAAAASRSASAVAVSPAGAAPEARLSKTDAMKPNGLKPFTMSPDDSIEEILLQLKARLTRLYDIAREPRPR